MGYSLISLIAAMACFIDKTNSIEWSIIWGVTLIMSALEFKKK